MLNSNKDISKFEEIPFGRPSITIHDRKAVNEVLNGHILTHGPKCKLFEEVYQELPYINHASFYH